MSHVLGSAGRQFKSVKHVHAGSSNGSSESGTAGNGASSAGAAVMTGPEFRERVLRADRSIDRRQFTALWPELRVMGRCSPQDKYTIVRGEQSSTQLPCHKHLSAPCETLMRSSVPCCPSSPTTCLDALICQSSWQACGLDREHRSTDMRTSAVRMQSLRHRDGYCSAGMGCLPVVWKHCGLPAFLTLPPCACSPARQS